MSKPVWYDMNKKSEKSKKLKLPEHEQPLNSKSLKVVHNSIKDALSIPSSFLRSSSKVVSSLAVKFFHSSS